MNEQTKWMIISFAIIIIEIQPIIIMVLIFFMLNIENHSFVCSFIQLNNNAEREIKRRRERERA